MPGAVRIYEMSNRTKKISEFKREFELAIERHKEEENRRPLWPKHYCSYDWETAWKFITTELRTIDQAVMPARIASIPKWPSLRFQVQKAMWCRQNTINGIGITDANPKSRRMIATWIYVALDLWEAGVFPGGNYFVSSLDWPKTGSIIWRTFWMYNDLARRKPEWNLPVLQLGVDTLALAGERSLKQVKLPNGSMFVGLTMEQPESFIQEGARRVRLEEMSKARYPALIMENSRQMCTPPRGEDIAGGNITIISTVMPGWFKQTIRQPASEVRGYWPAWRKQNAPEGE